MLRRPCFPLALLLALLSACGCERGGGPLPAAGGIDLIERGPDGIIDQPGRLLPGQADVWGDCAFDGWRLASLEQGGRSVPVAWAEGLVSRLRLPALSAAARTLTLRLAAPAPEGGAEPPSVAVSLNGTYLGTVTPAPTLGEHDLMTPADAWQRGDNVLTFEVPRVLRGPGGEASAFALSELSYDRAVAARRERHRYRLESGAALIYRFERSGPVQLALAGSADGPGQLVLEAGVLDPETGQVGKGLWPAVEIPAQAGALSWRGPPPGGERAGILELEISWRGAADASAAEVRQLTLIEAEAPERPSIVLISIDTLAARNMSLHGYARETTPNLETFARDAIRFDRCLANAPWTIPSYLSQLTGLYPRAHRTTSPEGHVPQPWEEEQLAPSRWTLAEMLRARGYRTAAFVDNPWLAAGFGFEQGFSHYDVSAAKIPLSDPRGGMRHVAGQALAWLDARAAPEPFFLFLQAFDPHAPYQPSERWRGAFAGDGKVDAALTLPVGEGQSFAFGCVPTHVAWHASGASELPARVAAAPIVDAYDEKVLEVDHEVGRFLAALRERGLYDESLIVFSADHGESLLAHDFHFNHALVYDETVHVPLLLRLPGGAGAGTAIDRTVQLVDLYPTVAEIAGSRMARDHLHGRSLLPLIAGAEWQAAPVLIEGWLMDQQALVWQGWKLVLSHPLKSGYHVQVSHSKLDRTRLLELVPELEEGFLDDAELEAIVKARPEVWRFLNGSLKGTVTELYYLPDDPGETRDLSAEHPERVAALMLLLQENIARAEAARRKASFSPFRVTLSDALEAELRGLGYVGDSE